MRVHRISGDSDFMGVRCAKWPEDKILMRFDTHGQKLPSEFRPLLSFYFTDPVAEGVVTDFPYMCTNSTLVLSYRAAEVLGPMLLQAGSFIDPVTPENMKFKLFVCETQLDAVDEAQTSYFPEPEYGKHEIKSFVLRPKIVEGHDIFRVKNLANRLFASEQFVQLVTAHRLTGLKVRPVWSSEEGSLAIFKDPLGEFHRYPPGWGRTLREKRQAMRDYIAGRR